MAQNKQNNTNTNTNNTLALASTDALTARTTQFAALDNGNIAVKYFNDKGEECNAVLASKEEAQNVYSLAQFSALRGASTFAVCYELAEADRSKVYERFGFKSLAQFAESIADIKDTTVKQYKRVGYIFMKRADGDGEKRYSLISELLLGASVANLIQCLALVDGEDNKSGLQFVSDYVESGDIPITSTLAMVKKAIAKLKKGEVPNEQNKDEQNKDEQKKDEQGKDEQGKDDKPITPDERKAVITGALDTARRNLIALLGKDESTRINAVIAEVTRLYM